MPSIPANAPRLTSLSSCAGCAAKLGQKALEEVLRDLPGLADPNLLVGSATADDAGVYRLDDERAIVQTLDFFTPIVDDPFHFGQIAAANALSDVYAMGGRPITAMNIVGMPTAALGPEVIARILLGGARKVMEAKCCLVGGHSIRSPEPIYGLSVTGMVHPGKVMTNANGRPGDLLLLTKPLGTGITTTAIKRGLASNDLAELVIRGMCQLNAAGADLAESQRVTAGTDVTGFGLLGHLGNVCRGSHLSATIRMADVPAFGEEIFALIAEDCVPGGTRTNMKLADEHTDWGSATDSQRILLTDAQTSGPLLLCVPPDHLADVRQVLTSHGTLCQAVIGELTEPAPALILVR